MSATKPCSGWAWCRCERLKRLSYLATRAATLGIEELGARLAQSFKLLIGGRGTALPRRAALGSSYELLPRTRAREVTSAPVRCLTRALVVWRCCSPDPYRRLA